MMHKTYTYNYISDLFNTKKTKNEWPKYIDHYLFTFISTIALGSITQVFKSLSISIKLIYLYVFLGVIN
jgi:hypothetical protein